MRRAPRATATPMPEESKCCNLRKASAKEKFVIFWNMFVIRMKLVKLPLECTAMTHEKCPKTLSILKTVAFL